MYIDDSFVLAYARATCGARLLCIIWLYRPLVLFVVVL